MLARSAKRLTKKCTSLELDAAVKISAMSKLSLTSFAKDWQMWAAVALASTRAKPMICLETERTIERLSLWRCGVIDEVIVLLHPIPGLRGVIHGVMQELEELMRVLRILVLQEGMAPHRRLDIGHFHHVTLRHEIACRRCLTCDWGRP
jgi:hypothetical protein